MNARHIDSIRLQILEKVMKMDDELLLKVHSSLDDKNEAVLYELLTESASQVRENKSLYTTKEVIKSIDKELMCDKNNAKRISAKQNYTK